jgi:hypothetical protein
VLHPALAIEHRGHFNDCLSAQCPHDRPGRFHFHSIDLCLNQPVQAASSKIPTVAVCSETLTRLGSDKVYEVGSAVPLIDLN